ncbi:type II secretion system F family protein [Candidatus Woesearchaeota archaeon]|nr:type II secretion system F family protein [Candidatus Woesearchaeota archaeon]
MRIAHLAKSPEDFVKDNLKKSLVSAAFFSVFAFLGFSRALGIMVVPVLIGVFILSFLLTLIFMMNTPKGIISRRRKEIEREVLFSGRFLLVKIESGSPLFNSLIDASKSFNVSSKYFREIVHDIETGTPIEVALERCREYNASEKFKKILWQILAAMKTGTEVTDALRSTLRSIANEQMIEIKAYGKKLNSLMLFYMVVACIVPSLGVSLFLIIASFLNLAIPKSAFFAALFGLFVVQMTFIIMIRASRPTMEL